MNTSDDEPRHYDELAVMADYSASGVWVRGACITDLGVLGISPALISDFAAWIDRYDALLDDATFDYDAFNSTGREIAARLKRELPDTRISYFREPAESESDANAPTWEDVE